jgi:hypothetical protein
LRSKISFGLIFTLLFTSLAISATANPRKVLENLNFVAGERAEIVQCAMSDRPAELQYRLNNFWIRLAKSKVVRDTSFCRDKYLPMKHVFRFTVPNVAESIEPSAQYTKMLLRMVGGKQPPRLVMATIFNSKAEKEKALGSQVASATTDWSKCIFKGRFLTGRVKVVSFGADYRIQLVRQNANLLVQETNGPVPGCGMWQFVNQDFDFTVQLVNEQPDFTIALTKYKSTRP